MVRRYIHRHRLEKKDPTAAIGDPVKPIEYWVDPGAPQDVRNALIEGASWWNQAFEAAGFRNAFKVAVLPGGGPDRDHHSLYCRGLDRGGRFSYMAPLCPPAANPASFRVARDTDGAIYRAAWSRR